MRFTTPHVFSRKSYFFEDWRVPLGNVLKNFSPPNLETKIQEVENNEEFNEKSEKIFWYYLKKMENTLNFVFL